MLTDLSRTYLEHLDAIVAGRLAVEADIARVIKAVRQELAKTDGEFTPEQTDAGLVLTVVSGNDDEFRWYSLTLKWTIESGWPELGFELKDLPPQLFEHYFSRIELPTFDRRQLLSNPVETCLRAWRSARALLDPATESAEFDLRHSGVMLLRTISRGLVPKLKKLPDTVEVTSAGATSSDGDRVFPAYVEWSVRVGEDEYEWCLTFDPVFGKGGTPWLALVVCEGHTWLKSVGGATQPEEYHGDPVVADFTPQLRAVLSEEQPAGDVAAEISEACLRLYKGLVAGQAPGTRPSKPRK